MKLNPRGKYNLNFIDWQNEFEAIADYMSDPQADTNPCGLDERLFKEIVVSSSCIDTMFHRHATWARIRS